MYDEETKKKLETKLNFQKGKWHLFLFTIDSVRDINLWLDLAM